MQNNYSQKKFKGPQTSFKGQRMSTPFFQTTRTLVSCLAEEGINVSDPESSFSPQFITEFDSFTKSFACFIANKEDLWENEDLKGFNWLTQSGPLPKPKKRRKGVITRGPGVYPLRASTPPATCLGCVANEPNQEAHMHPGGCQEEEFVFTPSAIPDDIAPVNLSDRIAADSMCTP